MLARWRFVPPLLVMAGLAGCHLTGGMPVDLDPGHGRVERTFTSNLGTTIRAALDALDDLEVAPKGLTVRANDRASELGSPKWKGQTNSEYFPNDASYRDLFEFQRLTTVKGDPQPFAPILVSYKGELHDGRNVVVVIRSLPPEARETRIDTRVGHNGDEALSQKFLDNIAERLNRLPKPPGTPQPVPPATAATAPPAPGAAAPPAISTPPADLPVLPPG